MFETLPNATPDPLLALITMYRQDPRDNKIDLGVGVYRDANGHTPIMQAVKIAEQRLEAGQDTKAYLGTEGDGEYVELIKQLIFGDTSPLIAGAQTPGGTGALKVTAELYRATNPNGRIFLGMPTWPNHIPVFESAGIEVVKVPFFDLKTQSIDMDAFLSGLADAKTGDAILLHGCCHNPTGADLNAEQWQQIADLCNDKGLLPIVDLAYHGLGDGMAQDLAGARLIFDAVPEGILASSCSKNFGLYRDRVGAVFAKAVNTDNAQKITGVFGNVARKLYSMPPDHGAAVVRIILSDDALRENWATELDVMRNRVNSLRAGLVAAAGDLNLGYVGEQKGMFSTLPLSPEQVTSLRVDHGVYMAGSGRINIAGLTEAATPQFVEALRAVQ
ncbi:MAG: aspartate/tyrosine/aromatic aminotransferase [Gammaproteobacteria bacterium]|nr:aspartate/tyrosine/aromatic aminotransferase [Gammaproteobacteria bacterium]